MAPTPLQCCCSELVTKSALLGVEAAGKSLVSRSSGLTIILVMKIYLIMKRGLWVRVFGYKWSENAEDWLLLVDDTTHH